MSDKEPLQNQSGEHGEPQDHKAAEYHAHSRPEQETSAERNREDQERSTENARREIENITAEHESKKNEDTPEHRVEHIIDSKAARKRAYDSIMSQAHTEMSAPERIFSNVIHNPIVENISEFAGKTIARPDAILSGAVSAFLLTLIIYLVAKQSGYPLTGTETTAAFIIGWAVGNIYDFAKTMLRGNGKW